MFNDNIGKGIYLLALKDGSNIDDFHKSFVEDIFKDVDDIEEAAMRKHKQEVFGQDDVDRIYSSNLMSLANKVKPFETIVEYYAYQDDTGNTRYDYDLMYEHYKENKRFYRITWVMRTDKNEKLAKRIWTMLRKENRTKYGIFKKSYEEKKFKGPWVENHNRKERTFDSEESAKNFIKNAKGEFEIKVKI